MRNHEVTKIQQLLDAQGHLAEAGWARTPVWQYRRTDVQAPRLRIKEWDYYLIVSHDHAVAFTLSDDGYIGLQSVSFLDFAGKSEHTESILNVFPMGKMHMPSDPREGSVHYADRRLTMDFELSGGKRHITCRFLKFDGDRDFSCDLTLTEPEMDKLTITLPWNSDPHAFYYNRKVNCMPAEGEVRYGEDVCRFSPVTDFGTLDWGRGVWTYDNTWLWSNGNGIADGHVFGYNFGYGFADNAAATENVLYIDGRLEKLDDVIFDVPKASYTDPWYFHSDDGRVRLTMQPILDRKACTKFAFILSDQHQVFGRMNGEVRLEDGTVLRLQDFTCFAEQVHNKY